MEEVVVIFSSNPQVYNSYQMLFSHINPTSPIYYLLERTTRTTSTPQPYNGRWSSSV